MLDQLLIEDWDRTIQVNLSGAFYHIRQASALMKPQGSGLHQQYPDKRPRGR
jgi:NAD(P)-dependent dehydrogenase (short-subunit alcohol dehydrogenase family)